MGCGCGKKSLGAAPTSPKIYGTDDTSLPVRRVVVLQGSGGAPAGATRYVRGSGVDQAIADGILRALDAS